MSISSVVAAFYILTLLFTPKRLEIVHQERRGQVETIVKEHFNSILFHKSGHANKHHTIQPPDECEYCVQYNKVLDKKKATFLHVPDVWSFSLTTFNIVNIFFENIQCWPYALQVLAHFLSLPGNYFTSCI